MEYDKNDDDMGFFIELLFNMEFFDLWGILVRVVILLVIMVRFCFEISLIFVVKFRSIFIEECDVIRGDICGNY